MVELVTLQQVKDMLRFDEDEDDDDATLELLIKAASNRIVNYLKDQADAVLGLDSSGELPSGADVPAEVEAATVMLVGYLFKNPDQDPEKDWSPGYLPRNVASMIYQLRDPALA